MPEFALDEVVQVPAYVRPGRTDWYEPHVSEDGRYVAFASFVGLDAADTNGLDDVYVVDLETNELTWASRTHDGSTANGGSWKPEISPDGRYVAFMSKASNLLPADQDRFYDVFVFDRDTEELECITADQDGDALSPRFSGDNQRIVYEFELYDNKPSNPNAPTKDAILYDRTTGERRVITTGILGRTGNDITWRPHISHDGQFVVFQSQSSNLVPNDTPNNWDVFLYDVAAETLECLSVWFTYTPAENFNGTDTFTYQAVDSLGNESNVATVTVTVNSVIDAVIDIKPGRGPNSINLGSKGVLSIAILSTQTAAGEADDFDATKVLRDTIKLNGIEIDPRHVAFEDIDGDGDLDLLLHFSMLDIVDQGILDADSLDLIFSADFDGGEADGPDIVGSDSVRIVPQKGKGKSGK